MRSRWVSYLGFIITAAMLAPVGQIQGQIVAYGATTGGQLLQINLSTGAGTLIGPIGFSGIESIEFVSGGTLLGIANTNRLISINPTTGAGQLLGTVTGFNWVEALAYSSATDTLYASATTSVNAQADRLITINPTTGQPIFIAPSPFGANFGDVDGLAVSATGTILGSQINVPGPRLFSVDPLSGQGSFIGNLSTAIVGLDFAPDGTLFGVTIPDIQNGGPSRLVSVNPNTGTIQDIGPIGFDTLQSFAITAVPEPGSMAFLSTVVIGSLACVHLRRRRTARVSWFACTQTKHTHH